MNDTTIAFSSHRPEVLPFAEALMESHDVIVLEEPPTPGFAEMLKGSLPIDDYVLRTETEYPEFTKQSCLLWRRLTARGKTVHQVEPYLETLVAIHEFFADGGRPGDIVRGTNRHAVYMSEKAATGRLIAYYRAVVEGDFTETVEAVKRFALADARRFILRDRMRAEAMPAYMAGARRLYIEAGEMHAPLWQFLSARNAAQARLARKYLMAPVVAKIAGKPRIFPPGDQLTLRFMFRGERETPRDTLLAAQAVVYNKILEKSEMLTDDYPHARDEIRAIRTVRRLGLEDCRLLYPRIRLKKTAEARRVVADYLEGKPLWS